MNARHFAITMLLAAVACSGSSPTTPAPPATPTPTPPTSPAYSTTARILDAIAGTALSGVSAVGADISGGPSGATGTVTVGSSSTASTPRVVTFTRTGSVTRIVNMRVPGNDSTVTMIPSTFSLDAFDELLRVSRLQRWTSAPPLRVQSRVLQFTTTGASDAVAVDEVLEDSERVSLEEDLTWALPRLTGNTFQAFASVTREAAAVDERFQILNTGVITVARYKGLTAATGYWGYSRWQFRSDGTVIAGTIMLDRDFERSGSVYRRSLRAHELGHALGYTHVTLLTSVMNSNARTEPNTFDQQATLIAFQRPPGNIKPDTDPSDVSLNRPGAAVWSRGEGAPGRGWK